MNIEEPKEKITDVIKSPDPDYDAIARNPKSEWNERMWIPDERFENRVQVRRSDDEIRRELAEIAATEAEEEFKGVEVRVAFGEVMLSGRVETEERLKRCYHIVGSVSGVQHIFNNIEVIERPGSV